MNEILDDLGQPVEKSKVFSVLSVVFAVLALGFGVSMYFQLPDVIAVSDNLDLLSVPFVAGDSLSEVF